MTYLQLPLPLDRIVCRPDGTDHCIETHIDDWPARLELARAGLGPWPMPEGHCMFETPEDYVRVSVTKDPEGPLT